MTRGVPWWSSKAPPVVARAPIQHGPFRCYQCWDRGTEGTLVGGVYRVDRPCSNPACPIRAKQLQDVS